MQSVFVARNCQLGHMKAASDTAVFGGTALEKCVRVRESEGK